MKKVLGIVGILLVCVCAYIFAERWLAIHRLVKSQQRRTRMMMLLGNREYPFSCSSNRYSFSGFTFSLPESCRLKCDPFYDSVMLHNDRMKIVFMRPFTNDFHFATEVLIEQARIPSWIELCTMGKNELALRKGFLDCKGSMFVGFHAVYSCSTHYLNGIVRIGDYSRNDTRHAFVMLVDKSSRAGQCFDVESKDDMLCSMDDLLAQMIGSFQWNCRVMEN